MFFVILLFAMFSSIFTLQKVGLLYSEPFFLVGSRMLFAGILLLCYQCIFKKERLKIHANTFLAVCLYGFVAFYVTNVAEIWGINNMFSSKACLIYSLSPFLTALIAYFSLSEVLTQRKWLGMVIGFLGLVPIIYHQTPLERSAGTFGFFTFAEMAVLLAAVASAYGWVLLKKVVDLHKGSAMMANGIGMTVGGVLALIQSYFCGEHWNPVPLNNYALFIENMLVICLISNVICYNLYGHLLKKYTATFMSFSGLMCPLFASLFGWFFLGETVSWYFFVSVLLFSVGLFIFHQDEMKYKSIL